MNAVTAPPHSPAAKPETSRPTESERWRVFWNWCLEGEVRKVYLFAVLLLIVEGSVLANRWPTRAHPNLGSEMLRFLFAVAAMIILAGAVTHASRAVNWEISAEMRELVRLTGLEPMSLLCCKCLSRWLTITLAVVVLLPGACFATTLGGVTVVQVLALSWALLMVIAVTAGAALLAGVTTTDTDDGPNVTPTATVLLLVLYHAGFGFATALIGAAAWIWTGQWGSFAPDSWWQLAFDMAWQSAPLVIVIQVCEHAEGFSPLSPKYWIHFLVAGWCFRMAFVVMSRRFRSVAFSNELNDEPAPGARGQRPRCTDTPLFWKDAEVLSGGKSEQHRWTMIYVGTGVALLIVAALGNESLSIGAGAVVASLLPVVFAGRLDGLVSSEFRQQTWQSLMLLPIDRRTILHAKFNAVAWQQRAAAIPAVIAVVIAGYPGGLIVVAAGVVVMFLAIFRCQMSLLGYLRPGGCLNVSFAVYTPALLMMMTALDVSPWVCLGAVGASLVLAVVANQFAIHRKLEDWTEWTNNFE